MLPASVLSEFATQFEPADLAYRLDPTLWCERVLGEHLWSKQVDICRSVVEHRYTAVPSCFDAGKSFVASRLIRWWLDVHPVGEAFVVWTAPTYYQVDAIIGRELRAITGGLVDVVVDLSNRVHIGRRLVGYGRKPADYKKEAFQGIHDRYVLVLIDEANGVPKSLYDAVDGLSTNENARVAAIGNPDAPGTHFETICKPASGWNVVQIDGFDTPNFSGEDVPERLRDLLLSQTWVEERRARWGEDSALWSSKVRGRFPDVSDDTLFPPSLVKQAQANELVGGGYGQLAYDIARMGPDETIGYRNRGGVIRLAYSAHKQDTMQTTGAIARTIIDLDHLVPAWVDADGLGAGVYDRLMEQHLPVHPWHGGLPATDPARFVNRRAEAYWHAREDMLSGLVDLDPDDDLLEAQLTNIKFKLDSRGRIAIESKDDMRKRGLRSPDRADALVMALWKPPMVATPIVGSMGGERSLTADLLDRRL